MAAPVKQDSAPPPTADVDEVIQMLIKDGKRREDDVSSERDADYSISREEKCPIDFSTPSTSTYFSLEKKNTT